MKFITKNSILLVVLLWICQPADATPHAGFYMPDHLTEITFRYKSVDDLIILPVVINDSLKVNLILDTGCRNLVLFGKRFHKYFNLEPNKRIQFSGLGSGKPVSGQLSINNQVSIHEVMGEKIPVIIIPEQNLFEHFSNIHGIIGYDIFTKFEVKINPFKKQITFRPAGTASLEEGFTEVPIRVEDSRPLIDCQVVFTEDNVHLCDLMIDTGSTLGILLKTTDKPSKYVQRVPEKILGRGLNGNVSGIQTWSEKIMLSSLELTNVSTGIIYSSWHNNASVGMEVLKDYTLVINYCKGYAGFRKAA